MTAARERDAHSRFDAVFAHYGRLVAYARRRAAPDPEAVAAEALEIAWRRLHLVPADDPLPWLYRTAGHVLANQRRATARAGVLQAEPEGDGQRSPARGLYAVVLTNFDPMNESWPALEARNARGRVIAFLPGACANPRC